MASILDGRVLNGRALAGCLVTAIALFIFGFIYWALNPLPYHEFQSLSDPAQVQAEVGRLFPQDGIYFVPGTANDPGAVDLLTKGPVAMLVVEHSPLPPGDPVGLSLGVVQNFLVALLLCLLLAAQTTLKQRMRTALLASLVAVAMILGSEVIYWMQPVNWLVHHVVYYLLYTLLAAWILNFFLPKESE